MLAAILVLTVVFSLCSVTGEAAAKTDAQVTAANIEQTGYEKPKLIQAGNADMESDSHVSTYRRTVNGSTSYWAQYSSNYYYSKMTGDRKALYEALYSECMSYLTTTANLTNTYTDKNGSTYYLTDPVSYGSLTAEDAYDTVIAFTNSNPQFYFIDGESVIYSSNNKIAVNIFQKYMSGTTRETDTNALKSILDSYESQIASQSTTVAKEKMAHDLVCNKISYATSDYDQSCVSVFLGSTSVCAGYAEAYELLCTGAGIPTVTVTSDGHEWTKSYIGSNWYVVDPTWDDTMSSTVVYYLFDISDSTAKSYDTGGNAGEHTEESFWSSFGTPAAPYDYGNESQTTAVTSQSMYRLYNPNSGEHFYTASSGERDVLISYGWSYEGIGWTAPTTGNPVYRVYNPNAGDHHYTMNSNERDNLVASGWRYEGIAFYSDQYSRVPLYRAYNPNAQAGAHNYTVNLNENNMLCTNGWRYEGVAWYGVN